MGSSGAAESKGHWAKVVWALPVDCSNSLELLLDRKVETLVWPGRMNSNYLGPGLLSSLEGPLDP